MRANQALFLAILVELSVGFQWATSGSCDALWPTTGLVIMQECVWTTPPAGVTFIPLLVGQNGQGHWAFFEHATDLPPVMGPPNISSYGSITPTGPSNYNASTNCQLMIGGESFTTNHPTYETGQTPGLAYMNVLGPQTLMMVAPNSVSCVFQRLLGGECEKVASMLLSYLSEGRPLQTLELALPEACLP